MFTTPVRAIGQLCIPKHALLQALSTAKNRRLCQVLTFILQLSRTVFPPEALRKMGG